jgi:hypothetical protein
MIRRPIVIKVAAYNARRIGVVQVEQGLQQPPQPTTVSGLSGGSLIGLGRWLCFPFV